MSSKNTPNELRSRIETTGELRQYIADCMLALGQGEMKVDHVIAIVKGAASINESLYSEIKVASMTSAAGGQAPDIGSLPINAKKK